MSRSEIRCHWADRSEEMTAYHDHEWGVPLHDERRLFELLVLEGAQAGLSWSTVLSRRDGYRKAFDGFDPRSIATFGQADIDRLLEDPGIIRNRRKIESVVDNAKAYVRLEHEALTLDGLVWSFVGGVAVQNQWRTLDEVPSSTEASMSLSRGLRQRGFNFVGPTICYAFMQSAGLVNDHVRSCFRWRELAHSGPGRSKPMHRTRKGYGRRT